MEISKKHLAEKEAEIERIIQENEHELNITKEALENKRKELATVKAALSGNNEEVLKKIERVEEEKGMFQMELVSLTERLNELQQKETEHEQLLKEKEEQIQQLLKDKENIAKEAEELRKEISPAKEVTAFNYF